MRTGQARGPFCGLKCGHDGRELCHNDLEPCPNDLEPRKASLQPNLEPCPPCAGAFTVADKVRITNIQ